MSSTTEFARHTVEHDIKGKQITFSITPKTPNTKVPDLQQTVISEVHQLTNYLKLLLNHSTSTNLKAEVVELSQDIRDKAAIGLENPKTENAVNTSLSDLSTIRENIVNLTKNHFLQPAIKILFYTGLVSGLTLLLVYFCSNLTFVQSHYTIFNGIGILSTFILAASLLRYLSFKHLEHNQIVELVKVKELSSLHHKFFELVIGIFFVWGLGALASVSKARQSAGDVLGESASSEGEVVSEVAWFLKAFSGDPSKAHVYMLATGVTLAVLVVFFERYAVRFIKGLIRSEGGRVKRVFQALRSDKSDTPAAP